MNKSRNITKNIISVLFIVVVLLGCMAVISLNNQGTQEIANAQSKEFIASVGKQEEKIITSLSQSDELFRIIGVKENVFLWGAFFL